MYHLCPIYLFSVCYLLYKVIVNMVPESRHDRDPDPVKIIMIQIQRLNARDSAMQHGSVTIWIIATKGERIMGQARGRGWVGVVIRIRNSYLALAPSPSHLSIRYCAETEVPHSVQVSELTFFFVY